MPFPTALEIVEELRPLVPPGVTMASWAMRWILMNDAVTCAIPGGRRPSQVEENVRAAELPPLSEATMAAVRAIYERRLKPIVHQYW